MAVRTLTSNFSLQPYGEGTNEKIHYAAIIPVIYAHLKRSFPERTHGFIDNTATLVTNSRTLVIHPIPPAGEFPDNATAANIATWKNAQRMHDIYVAVTEEVAQELLRTVPTMLAALEVAQTGFANVELSDMLTHLGTTYGLMGHDDIKQLMKRIEDLRFTCANDFEVYVTTFQKLVASVSPVGAPNPICGPWQQLDYLMGAVADVPGFHAQFVKYKTSCPEANPPTFAGAIAVLIPYARVTRGDIDTVTLDRTAAAAHVLRRSGKPLQDEHVSLKAEITALKADNAALKSENASLRRRAPAGTSATQYCIICGFTEGMYAHWSSGHRGKRAKDLTPAQRAATKPGTYDGMVGSMKNAPS